MNVIKRYHYIYFCVSVTPCMYVMKKHVLFSKATNGGRLL